MSEIESYKETGIKKYRFLATLDIKTSEVCRNMDGKEFDVDKAVPGENLPPLHPWCRSTTISTMNKQVMDKLQRRARDPVTGKTYLIPANMNYNEWYDKYVKSDPQAALSVKKFKNKYSDKKQHEKYRAVLGENVPKSFAKFQDLKYNDVNKWRDIKYYARYIDGRPIEYVKIDRELEKLGITNKGRACVPDNGIKAYILPDTDSKREPYHIMHRMKERNITDDDVRSFKDNAIIAMSQWNGKRMEYYSYDGVCVISKTDTGWVYKTAWKKEDYDETTIQVLEVCKKYVK